MKKFAIIAMASLLFLGLSGQSMASVNINVNIPPPPVFTFSGPPELVLIPGTYAYYDPDVDFNLFFYSGYWYRPYRGYWFRSASYEGPWIYLGSPPPVLVSLPSDYRIVTRGYRHIPYWELRRNWRTWQTNRYWDRHNWNNYWRSRQASAPNRGRTERQREQGVAPSYGERNNPTRGNNSGRMEHQSEHGLAPSYRGGGEPGNGAGTIRPRNESRGGATRQSSAGATRPNQGAATHENRGVGAAGGGATRETR